MKTALIIHGHFYQPPRENPNTGIVEDQISALPYRNWNEAIYQTCYKPNAYSRYLNSQGKILSLNNNYENISVNFGPTLLKWIDDKHPVFMKKLLEADQYSIKSLGHSNFIAQCYNHTILPLDSNEIKRIEISWALEDYKKRFGHESEGFWCPECAIDQDTIDELAKAGIKFVILSPWQATAINGVALNGKPAPCDRPFIIKGKKHKIAAFFYDPDLASGISFGHYLTDADRLYSHLKDLKNERNNPALITCATDGEIYGHHEAFGDMALAALVKKVNAGTDFYITNYASYLENNPATEEAVLFNGGKSHSGSSWSCCHGVERWCADCGCHTGGPDSWNQKWRAPLRKALNNLETKAHCVITEQLTSLLGKEAGLEEIMTEYGKVIAGSCTLSDFLSSLEAKCEKTLSSADKETVAKLLNSYKNILFSFTSCGWFFNDISGLEPRQNISYAVNAARSLNLVPQLLKDLSKAESNIKEEGSGEDIAKSCLDAKQGSICAGIFYIRNAMDIHIEKFKYRYGIFNLRSISNSLVVLENTRTLELYRYFYSVSHNDGSTTFLLKNAEDNTSYMVTLGKEDSESKMSKMDILTNITASFGKDILENGLDDAKASLLVYGLDGLRTEGIEPDLTELQNEVYPYITGKIKSSISEASRKALIEKLNFSYDLS